MIITVVIVALVVAQFVSLRLIHKLARYVSKTDRTVQTLHARVDSLERGVTRG
jgi:hypothetical protein